MTAPSAWRGAVAGLAAGLVASAAMDLFQRGFAKWQGSDSGGESATSRAADRVSEAATGESVSEPHKPAAGEAVHYTFGALLGAGYGLLAEFWPQATTGAGVPFGLASAVLVDETAVPLAGLASPPWEASLSTHAYSAASHLIFGMTAEAIRRVTRAAL